MRNIHALVVVGLLLLPMFAEATEQWYPSQGVFATWAFEDNWPSMGDYDFNDLVVDYRIHIIGDGGSPERVREMDIVTRFKARGATFHSGFGISVPVDPGILTAGLSPTKIGCPFQVVLPDESGGSPTSTFVFFTDAFDVLRAPTEGNCVFINTDDDPECEEPFQEYGIHLEFAVNQGPVMSTAATLCSEVNPFIFRDATALTRTEIHLPAFVPTSKMDYALFGTGDDRTSQTGGDWGNFYQTATGLPWALDLPTGFVWPIRPSPSG